MNRYKFAADKKTLHPCLSKENMLDCFFIDSRTGTLTVEKWIDEMPAEYRDIAADACVEAWEEHVGKKANAGTVRSFVDSVYNNIIKDQRMSL